MRDEALAAVLGHSLGIEKATVASGPGLGVAGPGAERVAEAKGLVQPVAGTARMGLLGLFPERARGLPGGAGAGGQQRRYAGAAGG